jgi:hypothetical protein
MPKFERRAEVIDWSERAQWSKFELSVMLFRAFKGEKSYVPMILAIRPFRWPKSFRFFQAFQDFKHGKEQPLRELESQINAYFAIPSREGTTSE